MISLDHKGIGLLFAVGLGALWYLKSKALPDVAAAISDPDNPVNQAAEGLVDALGGDPDEPAGGELYDYLHNDDGSDRFPAWHPADWLTEAMDAIAGV